MTTRRGSTTCRVGTGVVLSTLILGASATLQAQPPGATAGAPLAQAGGAAGGSRDLPGPGGGQVPAGWEMPAAAPRFRFMVLAGRRAGHGLRAAVSAILEEIGDPQSSRGYRREARRRGLRWDRESTFAQLLPAGHVDLVVVVTVSGRRRARRLKLQYRDGRTGEVLLEAEHFAGGDHEIQIRREAELVMRAISPRPPQAAGPDGAPRPWYARNANGGSSGPPAAAPEETRDVEDEEPVGSAVNLRLVGGLGVGGLVAKIPGDEGTRTLSLDTFLVLDAGLRIDVEPTAMSSYGFSAGITYRSSAGLSTFDQRGDGSIQSASARVQRLEITAAVFVRMTDSPTAVKLDAQLGWGLRIYDSPAELSFPDHTLGGPLLRALLSAPLWEGGVTLAAGPELHYLSSVDETLQTLGVASTAWAAGWLLEARYPITGTLGLDLAYRESYAWLPLANGSSGHEDERYVSLRLSYEP